jgi:hypothetical protein
MKKKVRAPRNPVVQHLIVNPKRSAGTHKPRTTKYKGKPDDKREP